MVRFISMSKMRNIIKNEEAFSLTELLIVIAIIGIITAIAVPNFLGMLSRTRLRKESWNLIADMETAKIGAVGDNSTWAVQFDTDETKYRVLSGRGPDGEWNTGDDSVFRTVSLSGSGVSFGTDHGKRTGAISEQFDGVTFGRDRVIFNPDGTSVMGTVYIRNGANYTIAVGSVSYDGKIKVWHNSGSGWTRIR
jgi:prepilin-type N-terminal cleavage/methylation domain-containing protein